MTFLKNYYGSAGISSGANHLSLQTCSSVFVELITLLVRHPGDAQADQHGRCDQNQDSTLERRNHAGTGPRRLRIAERAILRVTKRWNGQRRNQSGTDGGDCWSLVMRNAYYFSSSNVYLDVL